MSPEQANASPIDFRSDQFALGSMLYEMATAKKAFEKKTAVETLTAILNDEPEPIGDVNPQVPPPLRRIVERCLAKDPDQRWQSPRDLLLELKWAESRGGAETRAGSPPSAAAARMVPLRWALVTALLLAIVAAVPWVRSRRNAGATSAPLPEPPVVVLMDSPLADRGYDPKTLARGGTNADDINDILRDLDVQHHTENTSPAWHREEQVLKQRPRLVVAHLSCLRDDRGTQEGSPIHELLRDESWDRLRALLAYWGSAEPQTRFLLYSRGFPTESERHQFVSDVIQRFPVLRNRLLLMHVPGDERASFRDPVTAAALKQHVVAMLREEWRGGG